ncbi:LytR/AlgR family response regulator transcription factor [Clostridium niameyense]|uniref:LytR/AlgR family response regulator transcription factor n=1 Tax=Clostridium niameyense TaxID=1622073 RepID=UPI00067F31F8|nr:LytTR family DNA-binding domain-containing protein [Clostridium niameyense]
MYNIAICEDNTIQLKQISNLFNRYSINENVKFNIDTFYTGEQLLAQDYNHYDIIVLDIQMAQLNGIEVAKIIRKSNETLKIVFITALEKYWPDGYTVNAFRYFLKPLDEDVIYNEIKNLIATINKIFITVENNGILKKILISDITHLEIAGRNVIIHTNNSRNYVSSYKLKHWNEKLQPFGFANPHNSFLVNLNYVVEIHKDRITLLNGETLYVSQRKFKDFKKKFMEFLGQL